MPLGQGTEWCWRGVVALPGGPVMCFMGLPTSGELVCVLSWGKGTKLKG